MKNVDSSAALYLPTEESVTESAASPPKKVDVGQTPVAYTSYGKGWLRYVGDVNTEEGSDEVILAMYGL